MKKPIEQNGKWYSAMAGTILAIGHAGAQVSYTDVDPDTHISSGGGPSSFYLNLDGFDGTDFFIQAFDDPYDYYLMGDMNIFAAPWIFVPDNGVAGVIYSEGGFAPRGIAYQLESGASIGPGMAFFAKSDIATSYYYPQGFAGMSPALPGQPNFWGDDTDSHYIGLRLVRFGETYYGWLRLSVDPGFTGATIYDYAWQTAPGTPIIAGATGGCEAPSPLAVGAITLSSAKVKWSAVPTADSYELQFRALGAATWNTISVDAPKTFRKISGLDCSIDYEWQVRAICAGDPSEFSVADTFTTADCRTGALDDIADISIYSIGKDIYIGIDQQEEPAEAYIFDAAGALVERLEVSETLQVVHIGDASGVYIVKVVTGQVTETKKVVLM